MAINKTLQGILTDARTDTGRDYVKLPHPSCLTILFIAITGTASVNVEVSDDPALSTFFAIKSGITESTVIRVSMPASVVAVNTTANTGQVDVRYRILVLDNAPEYAIDTFQEGDLVARKITIDGTTSGMTLGDTRSRLYGPAQPGLTAATLYTVPASTTVTVECIIITNTTGADATITMSVGTDAAATEILTGFTVPANGILVLPVNITLEETEIIQALQGTSSALTVIINGSVST